MWRQSWRALRSRPLLNRSMTWAVRRVGGRGRFFEDHLPRIGKIEATLPNGQVLRLMGEQAEAVSNAVYWRGWTGAEPETAPIFWELSKAANRILDIGAHVGFYTLIAAHSNPAAEVIAVEALPHVADRLKHHVRLNDVENVRVIEGAVAASTGSAPFYYSSAIPLPSASGLASQALDTAQMTERETRTFTVDALLTGKAVDLIKIDTEGSEPDVLRGARLTLEKHHPALVFELLPGGDTANQINESLRPLGYEFSLLTDQGPVRRERLSPVEPWRNWLAQPKVG